MFILIHSSPKTFCASRCEEFMYAPSHHKEDYRDYADNEPYHELLELVVKSLDEASREGVPLSCGKRLHPIPIGNKGDWPYLDTKLQEHSILCVEFKCWVRYEVSNI